MICSRFFCVFLLGIFFLPFSLFAQTSTAVPSKPQSTTPIGILMTKMDEVSKKQDTILKKLDEIQKELYIVKIRASQ